MKVESVMMRPTNHAMVTAWEKIGGALIAQASHINVEVAEMRCRLRVYFRDHGVTCKKPTAEQLLALDENYRFELMRGLWKSSLTSRAYSAF
jgi:hypothetical protein